MQYSRNAAMAQIRTERTSVQKGTKKAHQLSEAHAKTALNPTPK